MSDRVRDQLAEALGGAYTIERELGGGGMSRVFVAREQALGRDVVVKIVAPELAQGVSAERFTREVRLAARLQHANIVPVLTAGDANGLPWYTMPFVRGESLRATLSRGGPCSITDAVNVLRDVGRALAYAHNEGIVHRDIKPDNILLSGGAAVVTDFGIAKALSVSRAHDEIPDAGLSTLTQAGTSIGTLAYMAPEQAAGDPRTDHRADLYAWGVVAWELLAGKHPFAAHSTLHALLAAQMGEIPPLVADIRADVPRALSELVRRCLEKDPARRPGSAAELLGALDQVTAADFGAGAKARWLMPRRAGAIGAAIAGVALAMWFVMDRVPGSTNTPSAEKSLAVLPFESVGGDTANIYFAEGIADELTTALARVAGLRVAARSSAFMYRNKTADAREAGKALDVNAVLQGRVRRAGSRMRLSAQLTSAADGRVLWTNSYEREVQDVFAVQDELTRDIVAALRIALGGGAMAPLPNGAAGTANLEAYDLYLRGLHFLQQRGGGVARSIDYFRQALAKDSSFARAWAQLGTAYALLPYYSLVATDSAIRQARAASDIALRLDPSSAEAHVASGMSFLLTNGWESALAEFERAIALDPDYTISYRVSMPALYMIGRSNDAIARGRLAAKLDPLAATTFAVYSVTLLNGNRRDEALEAARRAVELDSLNALARSALAVAEYFAGRADLAGATQRRVTREPHTSLWIGFVRAATGDREGAAALIRELEQERGRNVHAESAIAWTWLGAGDTTRALDALERAAKAREPMGFVGPFGHPAYDGVRQSARFTAILRAFGLEPLAFTN
jgi:serine/threonine-protein kinase